MQLGDQAGLREIESAYRDLIRAREVRENLARLGRVARAVEYLTCDVTDEPAFRALIEQVYKTHGRIDAVFCGAGVIADKRLADKPLDSFRAVMATKLDAARTLAATLRPETLRYLVFFGSVAGRFGNLGQTDYAAANAWLATLAVELDRAWPTRVVTIDWGPWDEVGMVAPELRRAMAARGVTLLPPDRACDLLLAELAAPAAAVEVVIAGLGNGVVAAL
jgi:NAD(P)-dependent dehydrogenase (short-subunit alcohol dehydrogenase family)